MDHRPRTRRLSVSIAIYVGGTQWTRLRFTPDELGETQINVLSGPGAQIMSSIELARDFARSQR